MKRLALSTILLACSAFIASGCVYKMAIQQGNYLVTDSVSQLKEGMTRSQVRFLLGTPMVPEAFDDSRWDYYYFYSSRKQSQPLKRRLTVYFADERVQRVENQGVPTKTDLDQLEQDLKRAIEANKKNRKKSSQPQDQPAADAAAATPAAESTTTPAPEPKSAPATPAEARPDPVPASAPLPVPAGTPSGQP